LGKLKPRSLLFQLFKRRNVATVEEDGALEDDGMADSGCLEPQANTMDVLAVRINGSHLLHNK